MILADKITNERKKNGWSQEELAQMLGVSRQSVSKWEGAQAVPDLQKILKLAEVFGVSTDYLLKDEIEPEDAVANYKEVSEVSSPVRRVSLEEVNEFIEAKRWETPRTAIATFLCVTCPVVLIFLTGLSEGKILHMSENLVATIGLLFLFGMIATAVFSFISVSSKMKKYEFFRTEDFETEYGVSGIIKEKRDALERKTSANIAIGVVMCICACVPLIVSALAEAPDFIIVSMVCVLLILIGIAVAIFINAGGVMSAYNMILQEGEYSSDGKKISKKIEPIMGIYWGVVVAIFLGYSFITDDWQRSWIVWPVAGVLCAVVSRISTMLVKKED